MAIQINESFEREQAHRDADAAIQTQLNENSAHGLCNDGAEGLVCGRLSTAYGRESKYHERIAPVVRDLLAGKRDLSEVGFTFRSTMLQPPTDWGDICVSEAQMKRLDENTPEFTVELPATMTVLRSQFGDTSKCEVRY